MSASPIRRWRIGPPPAARSYLEIATIVEAARATGAEAVHPGYGFLSERAEFARAVEDAGLAYVGPEPGHIALMGDKARAREAARDAGVPTIPGSDGAVADAAEAAGVASEIGLPGGAQGGRRRRRTRDPDRPTTRARCERQYATASREASGGVRRRPRLRRALHRALPATSRSRSSATATA